LVLHLCLFSSFVLVMSMWMWYDGYWVGDEVLKD